MALELTAQDDGVVELYEAAPAAGRFYDRILAALLRLRFRIRLADFVTPLLLWHEAPMLACGLPLRELAVLGIQRDLKYGLHALLPAAYFAVMALLAANSWPDELSVKLWWVSAACASLAVALIAALIKSNTVLTERLQHDLDESDILQRLAFQDEQLEDIYAAVPDLLCPLFMSLRRQGIDQHLALVAYNLDWYLQPRTHLLRLNWVCELLLLPFALVCWLYSVLGLPAGSLQEEPFVYAMALLGITAFLVSLWARRRTEVFMEALIVHLRQRLET